MRSARASVPALRAAAIVGLALVAACSAPGTEQMSTTSGAVTAFPNDKAAYDYFRAQGFATSQAAGIVGNLDQESGVDPTIAQQGGPGRGIAQWSAGGRWDTDPGDNVVEFAKQKGKSEYDLEVQLDFIVFELRTFPSYGLAKLQASTNVTDATTDFETDFEGCGACDTSARIAYANDVLAAYGNDGIDAGPPDAREAGPGGDAAPEAGRRDAAATEDGGAASAEAGGTGSVGPGPTAAMGDPSSGCAFAGAARSDRTRGGWLAAVALLAAATRRRARSRSPGKQGRPRDESNVRPTV